MTQSQERYELVTASELKVGDVVRIYIAQPQDWTVIAVDGFPGFTQVYAGGHSHDVMHGSPVLRRLPDIDEADVLRRALEIQYREMVDACIGCPIEYTTDQARRELESEAKHG